MEPNNNNNNKQKKKTKIIKKVTTRVMRNNKPRAEQSGIQTTPNQFRGLTDQETLSRMRSYGQHVRDRYIVGLVHPDIAVKNQIPVKLYSDVPIPTASIGWHEQYQLTTSSVGTFLLAWRPTFMANQQSLTALGSNAYSHLTFNNSSTLNGNTVVAGNNFLAGSYIPNIDLQRYRMVSSMITVQYDGPVLQQAGVLNSCATFDRFVCANGSTSAPVTNLSDPYVDRYGQFNLVVNGLWNQSSNVTRGGEGLEHFYVPLDPDDITFQPIGTYYGTTGSSSGTIFPEIEGAHINYVVCGRNFPASTNCVLVDVYYNLEVIADPSTAPILRSMTDNTLTRKDHEVYMDAVNSAGKTKGFIRKMKADEEDDGDTFSKVLGQVARFGIKYIPKILAAI